MALSRSIEPMVYIRIVIIFLYLQLGSEDALSSVDDLNINEQLSIKAHTLDQVK